MADKVRLNKVIDLLKRGQPVFSYGTVMNGNFDELMAISRADYDMAIIETEHQGFDFATLRNSLQYLVNRKRIAEKGNLQPDVVPFVRLPPYTREYGSNQWVIKQTLDLGPYGLVLPHLDSVEGAQAAVQAARYPQLPGAADAEPEGLRGWWPPLAPHYWGLDAQEYYDAADVWPLDPDGELLLMGIVENVSGVKNLRDIPAPGQRARGGVGRTGRSVGVHGQTRQFGASRRGGGPAQYSRHLQGIRCTVRGWRQPQCGCRKAS